MNVKEIMADVLPTIEKFAPTLFACLGGPGSLAASAALSVLETHFDGRSGDLPGLCGRIMNDPDVQKKLQDIETMHGQWVSTVKDGLTRIFPYPSQVEVNIKMNWDNLALNDQ